jgi:hypothetical protein
MLRVWTRRRASSYWSGSNVEAVPLPDNIRFCAPPRKQQCKGDPVLHFANRRTTEPLPLMERL